MTACRSKNLEGKWVARMKNNPAGVLLEKMLAVKSGHPNLSMTENWAIVFECKAEESGKIVAGIAMLMALSADAKASVMAYAPGAPEIFLAPLYKIDIFLTTHHLGGALSSYTGHLDDSTMTALAFTDHVLQLSFSNEQPGTTKQAKDFVEMLDQILKECLNSDLSRELKNLFVQNLEALRKALLAYRLGGDAELRDALDKVTGSIIRNQNTIKSEFDKAEKFVEKTAGFMAKIEEMINRGQSLTTLARPVMDVLLPFFR